MGPDSADTVRLRDMLDASRMALDLIGGSPSNEWTHGTWTPVAREIRKIEDAAMRVSQPFREAHEEIPWGAIGPIWPSSRDGLETGPTEEKAALVEQALSALAKLLEAIVPPQAPDDA